MKNSKILEIKIECYLNHWYPLYPFYIYTTIKFDLNDNIPIKDRINDFLKSKGIDNPNKKFIYLFKEEHAIMKFDPNKPISQISNNKGDKILLSDKEYKIKNEVNEVIIHSQKIINENEDDKSSTRKITTPKNSQANNQLEKNEKIILEFSHTIIKIINFVISLLVISGIIAFILTFIYVCFSGYIFTNDVAYGNININYLSTTGPSLSGTINKLFSNGARYKYNGNRYITSYEKSTEYNGQFVKYKDLGNKEYNYDKDRYIKYQENKPNNTDQLNGCNIYSDYSLNGNSKINNCDYLFPEPYSSNFNKYLYDRWLTTLILAVFIFILDIILAIFGFLLFINKEEQQKEYGNDLIVYGNK